VSAPNPERTIAANVDVRGGLRRRALSGTLWVGVGHGASQALRLGSNLVLTRLLFEEMFGLMALVSVFLQALQMFSDVGINANVIQNPRGDDPHFVNTAWTIGLLRTSLLYVACLVFAYPVAGFYGHHELVHLIPVAGLAMVIDALSSPTLMTMERHLEVKQLVLLNLAVQIVSVIVMITWAWISPTVWALLAGSLISGAFKVVASYAVLRGRRPRVTWDRASVGAIMTFGSWIMINTPLNFLGEQADRFTLGKLIPLAVLGVYQIAITLGGLPYQVLIKITGSVAFPMLSRAREQGRATREIYPQVRVPIEILGGWIVAGLIGCGPLLIKMLWDARWHAAAWMVIPIAVSQWVRILCISGSAAMMAEGRPRWNVVANTARVVGYLVCVPIGWTLYELPGALVGFAAGEAFCFVAYAWALRRIGIRATGASLSSSLLVLVSALAGTYVRTAMVSAGIPALSTMIATGLVVSAFWVLPAASQRKLLARTV